MKIIYIRPAKSRGYIRLGIDTGADKPQALTVSERDYREGGAPLCSDSIDSETYGEFLLSDMRYRAYIKALNILSFGDNSEKMLIMKLQKSGISRAVAENTAKEMIRLGYIDSNRQIEKIILDEVNLHNTGPAKIMAKLIKKGYSQSKISSVMAELSDSGKIDFLEAKERLLSKKLSDPSDEEEKKKILFKNGYSIC